MFNLILILCRESHNSEFNLNLEFWSNIVTLIGGITIVIAILDYLKKRKAEKLERLNAKLHTIKSIKFELEVIGHWTSFENGGYNQFENHEWFLKEIDRAQLGNLTYRIENKFLSNLSILPGYINLGDEINQQVAWLNQWICSFNTRLDEIRAYKYSFPIDQYLTLDQKLVSLQYDTFTEFEKQFVEKLMKMVEALHFYIIGNNDERSPTLHFWHRKLKISLENLEKDISEEISKLN